MPRREPSKDAEYIVTVKGRPKGFVWHEGRHWRWYVQTRGIELFRFYDDVAPFITRVCLAKPDEVTIIKKEGPLAH
jgi:hypothetical protein